MKLIKKITLLFLSALLCLSVGIVAGCKEEQTGGTAEPTEYVYKIRVQSEGGFGLKNVSVGLYAGNTLVKEKLTSAQGNAYFTEEDGIALGEYEVRLSDLPEGWSADESITYKTSTQANTDLNLSLDASLITDKEIPASKIYALGDVMYDFSVTTSDNKVFTLSEVLQEKKMVLLNFWATWCGPCKSEFPAMQNAYVSNGADGPIQDNVAILALSTTDSKEAVIEFKSQEGLTFDMAGEASLVSRFATSSIPVSVVIDRYGVISYMHVGSMTATSDFIGLFDKFTSENYVQTVIGAGEYEGGQGGEDGGSGSNEQILPNVSAPSTSEVNAVLNANGGFTSSWEDDEYSWPWTIEKDTDNNAYLRASNSDVHNSYSILNVKFQAQANDALFFDSWISTEEASDMLYVLIDGEDIHKISGFKQTWTSYCAYVFNADEIGEHTVSFCYIKDTSGSGGEDEVWLRNLRLGSISDIGEGKTVASVDIIRTGASVYNNPADIPANERKTQYKNYVSVVLNPEDGYYHVGNTEGPLLLADILSPTLWNEFDLWQLAYNDYLIYDGMNLSDAVENYAWACTNARLRENNPDLIPVTEDLKNLLVLITKIDVMYGGKANADKHVKDHAKEWLELCVYYEHYGVGAGVQDPTRGITYAGAIPLVLGENNINCDISIVPLGLKHKFKPSVSGVYHFYSTVAKEYEDTAEYYDPQCWIVEDTQIHLNSSDVKFLAYNDDNILAGASENFDNFDIYVHLDGGRTYYALFAFFLNATGKFPMRIDYVGETYSTLSNCAVGPYSFNEVTMETYLPSALNYEYDELSDTYYYDHDGNGTFDISKGDSALYLDMTRSTYMFTSTSWQRVIEDAVNYTDASKRLLYLDGHDYTPEMKKYLFRSMLNEGELYGMAKVDKTLLELLLKITKKYDGFGGVQDSWQMMCYYYKPVGGK